MTTNPGAGCSTSRICRATGLLARPARLTVRVGFINFRAQGSGWKRSCHREPVQRPQHNNLEEINMKNMFRRNFIGMLVLAMLTVWLPSLSAAPKSEDELIADLASPKAGVVTDAPKKLEKEN